ncbi:5913_t:CDS:2 [Funneliformis caledonium]|uniref:5913_t:CDS:1 n=1 Tax=Funneliformis caledonium TaxID=1117310 RepID=A0A9N9D6E1_9GLOM|nr:5913_t:CDS:2 [Funneliformis caledonium]
MDNYRRPRDVVLPTPGPIPEHIRKATIKKIIQQRQQERIEKNTFDNNSQNNIIVALQKKEEESGDKAITTIKTAVTTTTNSKVNGIDHNKKINGHFNAQEAIINGSDDRMSVDQEDDSEKGSLNFDEIISNKKNNMEYTEEIISSSRNQESLNKELVNPEPPPEPPDDGNGESSSNKKNSEKSILKGQNDYKEEEASDDSLPDEEFIVNKLEELKAKKKRLCQQLRDAIAKQDKKEPVVVINEPISKLKGETSANNNTGISEQPHRLDRHNSQSTGYISSNRDQYDSNYSSPYHYHEGDNTAFHHQLPLGIKRTNEQTSPPLGPMNKRIRHPPNGMHYESMIHGVSSMYGPPPTGPSSMTGNGMMGRGREDPYSYYHRNEFRPPPPTAPYIDRTYGRGPINNMRRLSGNLPSRSPIRPPDRPRGRY